MKQQLSPWHNQVEQFKYKILFRNPSLQIDMHWADISTSFHNHDYYEIMLITEGACSYRYKTGNINLSQGDLIITCPDEYHQITPIFETNFKSINLSLTSELAQNICAGFSSFFIEKVNTLCHQKINLPSYVYNYLVNLIITDTLLETNEYNYSITLKNWVHCVFTYINKIIQDESPLYPDWFKEILIEMALPESLSQKLTDTIIMHKYSATTLNRYFKEFLNTTPNAYFSKLKLEYSTQLLKHTDYSVSAIAQKIGFDSFSHFTRLFTKTYGITPSQYRKNSKKSPNYTPPPNC